MAIKYNKAHELAQSLKKKKKYENILNVLENNRTTTNAIQNRTTREINNRILNGGTIAPVYSSDTSSKKTQLNIISEEEQKVKLKTPLELLQEQRENQTEENQQNEKLKMPSELLQEQQQKQFEENQQKSKEASEKRVEQKKKDEKDNRTWFKSGAFKDGYDFGDVTKTLVGTGADVYQDATKGIAKIGEALWDTGAYAVGGIAKAVGNDDLSEKMKKFIAKNIVEEHGTSEWATNLSVIGVANNILNGKVKETYNLDNLKESAKNFTEIYNLDEDRKKTTSELQSGKTFEEKSVLGDKSDSLVQSAGQLLGTAGLQAVGVPWWLTTGVSSFGGEVENAFNNNATYGEAGTSGLISAGAEVLTEKISGGIKFGGKALDDGLKRAISQGISNKTLNTLTKLGVDATGEGAEEVLSEVLQSVGQKLTYEDEKTWEELLTSEEAMDRYLESFIGGAVLGGGSSSIRAINSAKTGRDYDTGLTQNEQSVIDNVVSQRTTEIQKQKAVEEKINRVIEEQEATRGTLTDEAKQEIKNRVMQEDIDYSTSKLSKKEIAKIEEEVRQDLERGEIDIDTIESTLSSEKTARIKELIEERSKTTNEQERLKIQAEIGKLEEAKNSELIEMLKKDNLLQNSYKEANLKNEKFTYEAKDTDSEYKKKLAEDFKKLANNSTRTHETFEMISKIAEDSETNYSITTNEQLKNLGYDIDGKDVNGLVRVNKDGSQSVLINIDSKKAINRIVGHETTHILEGTKEYDEFKEFAKQYATTKGEYDSRLKSTKELYKGVKDANVENEVTADIVGDYLFTDTDFVNSLSVEKPTVFQKVKDLIDDLVVKVKGTKEEKQLREVQKKFKEAYRKISNTTTKQSESNLTTEADSNTLNNVKYSIIGLKNIDKALKNKNLDDNTKNSLNNVKNNYIKALSKEGKESNESIRRETGWFKDRNGDWKFEITDKYSKLKIIPSPNKTYKLGDILDHKLLYYVNPEIKNLEVKFKDLDGKRGQYLGIPVFEKIYLNNSLLNSSEQAIRSTLLHEIQHYNQRFNKFERGMSSGETLDDMIKYVNGLGEIEAKNVQERMNLSKDELKAIAPSSSTKNPIHSQAEQLIEKRKREIANKSKKSYNRFRGMFNEEDIGETNGQNRELSIKTLGNGLKELDNSSFSLKQKQNEIIQKTNPVSDDYHTWIRNVDDIKTFEETLKDPDWSDYVDEGFNPDFTGDMVKEALGTGKITVYSSYPIEQGIFVSPSKIEAESYSGNGKVYSKEVNLTDVAWIDPTQGQYAKVNDTKYSLSENIPLENRVSGDELLDAQDLIDEVKSVGAQVDANGYVTVYHQTSNENAQIIKETGKMISKELDIFFSTSKDAQQSTGRGQTKLEFKIPAEKLLLDDIFSDNADVKIPLNGSRSLDVSNYLVTDYDTNLSLGNQQTAPARNDVFGKDIKYQDETTKQVEQAIAPLKEEVKTLTKEIPDEVMLSNIDNVAEKMIQEKQAKREKIEKNNTLNYISKDSTKESTYDDPSITNPVDAFLNKELTNRFEKRNKQTVISKQKGKSTFRDTMSYLFVNKNRAIDKYSDEVGNKNIKILADHVNNVFGEISTNISKVQTDNNGKAIGKGITEIFNQARKSKVSEAFDDYLFHKSNIERHKNGKGSVVPANDSARLVLEYEKTYPEFKTWGDEVNNFNKNNLYKQVDAGLITKELADNITNMYDFYVPFFENIERDYVKTDTGEITTRSAVKRAKGGADKNLLGFEKAMMKQTQNTISSIRKNQLYREIIDSTHNKQIGLDLNDGTFADENGYYLTAYEDGSQVSANISKELYDGLNNNLEQTVKDIEQKLSLITKPLQALSNTRRNLLTNWSPTFIITNPIKDFQDAPLNSKYAKDWAVNYPKALKELTTGKGEHLETFLNMYGQANLMGDYSIDSGISDITKSVKIKGKSKLSVGALNELAELTPRYAEYLASIKNGASQMEALYNAREVTTNFGRGGVISKALNRNGFTFWNASVQGFNKLYRNFSGENGAKGVVNASLKALSLGVAPALYNALMFGLGDDEDEDYKVLPDYIKDNYYLIKTDNGNFIRIPKGRMISVFGSAGRRTLELIQGEKDAFDGYLKNAYSQVGIPNPMEINILAPLIQAYGSENGKTWYGTDIVPSRLQDVPKDEQYDESIDKFSIWLGEKTGISPYKANYVIDQYTGGIGDMILPTITEEAQSDSDGLLGTAIAPLKDKFTADSTTDNKYVSEFYTKNDELKVKSNSSKATEEDLLVNQYMKSVSSEMGALYSEMREVQANKNLSKSEKYKKAQAIKKQINELAEEGLNGYKNVNKTDNYAEVGGREFYKWTNDEGEVVWSKPDEAESDELNAMGLDIQEKSSYYTTKSKIYDIWDKYGDSGNYESKNKEIGQAIINSGLPDEAKYSLYDFSKGKYADTETTQALKLLDLDADTFISYASQTFKADKDSNGKSISGSKKKKVFDYINSMRNISFEQKAILAKLQYNNYDERNYDIIDYLNNSSMTYEEMEFVLKQMGFKVKSDGTITWD